MTAAALSRQDQKEQTRRLILDAALRTFTKKGLLSTKTSDIAKAAGISHGNVFAHFRTRDELVEAVVAEVAGRIATQVRRDTADCTSVREVLSAHLKNIAEHEDIYIRLVLEGPFLPRDARRALVEIQSAIASRLEDAMESDVLHGRIRKVAVDLAFNTWIGLLHHYLANRDLFAPRGSVVGKWGQKLLSHYLDMMSPVNKRR